MNLKKMKVIDSRLTSNGWVRRRRSCKETGLKITTYEVSFGESTRKSKYLLGVLRKLTEGI